MKDPSGYIRSWLYTTLNATISYGGTVVPVYSFVPRSTSMPYILIGEQSSGPDEGTKDCYITKHLVTVEIWTTHSGNDASYVPVNTISNSVMELIRTRTQPSTLTGFQVIAHEIDNTITDRFEFENEITIVKVINLSLTIAEV